MRFGYFVWNVKKREGGRERETEREREKEREREREREDDVIGVAV